MRRLIDRCAGIDIGQALLVVCVRVVEEKGRLAQEVRSWVTGSDTRDLGAESIFGRTASCTEARASTRSSPHPRRVASKIIPLLRTTQ